MTKSFLTIKTLVIVAAMAVSCGTTQTENSDKYEATWESLAAHNEQPEWLKDAKLGIYFHWGVYCVPEYSSEWYPRTSLIPGNDARRQREETYGKDFYYHQFIPQFTAENFDANDWAELFKAAGAKFAGPVAEHHDGFSMWASDATPFNAKEMGPKRDIVGEILPAIEKQGLHTITTFHHARNLQRYKQTWQEEIANDSIPYWQKFEKSHYPYYPEFQEVFNSEKYALLYGTLPEEQWLEDVWLAKLEEVIDNYQPDSIWFDSWLDEIPEEYRQRFAAYYLNSADKWDKEVAIVRKQEDMPLEMSINNHEKSREAKAKEDLWFTDDTFSTGSWSYTRNLKIKETYLVVHSLVDAVSKNGVLLLNISPKADGTIPDNQRKGLHELGDWLSKNGEAIYSTRPWVVAAEGPTVEPEGGFNDHKKFLNLRYTTKDIRFTRSKDSKTIYAIVMGIPEPNEKIIIKALKEQNINIASIEAFAGDKIDWKTTDEAVEITIPNPTGDYAYAFKIKTL